MGDMKFISLNDANNQNIVTIDADSFILRIEIDGITRESRIKPLNNEHNLEFATLVLEKFY